MYNNAKYFILKCQRRTVFVDERSRSNEPLVVLTLQTHRIRDKARVHVCTFDITDVSHITTSLSLKISNTYILAAFLPARRYAKHGYTHGISVCQSVCHTHALYQNG